MPVAPGTRFGPYEILGPLGAGGMGEVYRARDTRLDRTVAIKILPGHAIDRADLRERFVREARAISSLNHPNICTLHDVGSQDGIDYLVMEHIEGETLAERLGKGPLPIDQALKVAAQIADALDKAHRQGLVHRDLKPGNVMLSKTGAKLLDFGLARLRHTAPGLPAAPGLPTATLSALPAADRSLTAAGVIVGTLQYMAPEQLEGREPDARTDIFSFGAVLYEMLTGRRAFEGNSQASLIASILHTQPQPVSSLRPVTHASLDRLVKRCLAKNPEDRWQTARDLAIELQWLSDSGGQDAPALAAPRGRLWRLIGRAGFVLVCLGALVFPVAYYNRPRVVHRLLRFSVLPPEKTILAAGEAPVLSPDGRLLAFVATDDAGRKLLHVRPLDSLVARPLSGTEGASVPFWSPDGRSLGFFAGGALKTIAATGGVPLTLANTLSPRGATWSRDGVIVFARSPSDPLYQVPAAGGEATPVLHDDADRSRTHFSPFMLPDGRHYLYLSRLFDPGRQSFEVRIGSLDSKETRVLLKANSTVRYSPPGYLLFRREGTLMAQRFDAGRLELAGEPLPIAEQVGLDAITRQACFSVSETGVLAYHSGASEKTQFVWVDRTGRQIGMAGARGNYGDLQLSPDDKSVAFHQVDADTFSIWVLGFANGLASRLTFGSGDNVPVWSPDGSRIVFSSNREGRPNLYQKTSTGEGNEELLLQSPLVKFPFGWSRDGRFIVYGALDPDTRWDLWVLPLAGGQEPFPFLQTPADERRGSLSPNGRWMAYVSNELERNDIYVRPFPPAGGKWQISKGGGDQPRWRSDGKELFYLASDRILMAVDVKTDSPAFESGAPRALFETRLGIKDPPGNSYAVTADGRRFLLNSLVEEASYSPITVVLDWTAALPE